MSLFRRRKKQPPAPAPTTLQSFFSTHAFDGVESSVTVADKMRAIIRRLPLTAATGTQDDSSNGALAMKLQTGSPDAISESLANWYVSHSFIGHQLAGMLAQHWLIDKACRMPGRDAIRNGFTAVSVDGDEIEPDAIKILRRMDRRMRINEQLEEFIHKGRVFGVRIAMFRVDSTDPAYYEKPFNVDGVTPNSYKGIVQIDPYWTAPQLDSMAASNPDSLHFYEPTYWVINGRKVHRSHLIIYRHADPVDILKPLYLYGGIPVPQMIMERVYAAERTANEAPQLAMTKRTNVWLTDMERVMENPELVRQRMNDWAYYRDNYGVKLGDKEGDEFQQYDTALGDLDDVIMTNYQLVAAAAGVPATKLLGTTPKGFNSTGSYEEANYHEELASIQTHDLTPFLERHHLLVMKAYVEPNAGGDIPETTISWEPLDSPGEVETAQANLYKAQTGQALIESGAIDASEERQRIALDKDSGYHELGLKPIEEDDEGEEEDLGDDF